MSGIETTGENLHNHSIVNTQLSTNKEFSDASYIQVIKSQSYEEIDSDIKSVFSKTEFSCVFCKCENDQVKILTFVDPTGLKGEESLKGFSIPLAKGISILKNGKPVFLSKFSSQSDFSNLTVLLEKRECKSVAIIPIIESGHPAYIMAIGSRSLEPISILQVQPYFNYIEIIGISLERINLVNQMKIKLQELAAINTVSEVSVSATTPQELFESLFQKIRETIGHDIGFAAVINNRANGLIQVPFFFDEEKVAIPDYAYGNDLISQVVLTENTIVHRDANALGLLVVETKDTRLPTRSFLGVPLTKNGENLGAIVLISKRDANRFSENDVDLLNALAPQISTSLVNVILIENQKSAASALANERFLLNSILQHSFEKIAIKDSYGNCLYKSDTYSEAESNSESSKVNDPNLPLTEGDHYSDIEDIEILKSGLSITGIEKEIIDESGKKHWELQNRIALKNEEGIPVYLLKQSRDITEIKKIQQVADHRANQLLTAAEIARETTANALQIDETLKRIVNLVKERFGFYHASIFLMDQLGHFSILREATGEAGAKLKEMGHKLAVGSKSIVGQVTSKVEPVVVNDVRKEINYYQNPLLPDTQAELAIPLKVGEKLIGVLDVQSDKPNAFTKEDITIFQVMGDQLSVAIQNADLFSKTQKTLERHRLLHQITATSGQSLSEEDAIRNAVQSIFSSMPENRVAYFSLDDERMLNVRASAGYDNAEIEGFPLIRNDYLGFKVIQTKLPIRINNVPQSDNKRTLGKDIRSILIVPVAYRSRFIGILSVESQLPGVFDESDQEIITTLANNLGSIISNINLLDQIRLQVDRQRQLYEITSKIRRSTDIETIMQTTLREVSGVIKVRKASITLSSKDNPYKHTDEIKETEINL